MRARAFRRTLFLGPALAVLALAVLSGCAPIPRNAQWSAAQALKKNTVLFLRQTHPVRFEPGRRRLSDGERRRLAEFLEREEVGYGDRVTVAYPMDPADAKGEALALRRSRAVTAYLASLGLRAAIKPSLAPGAKDSLTVVIGRHVVVPPACPNWRKPPESDPGNTPSSNLGCANTTNLGLMVADPADLILGRRAPRSDAERAASAIERYRKREEVPLQQEETTSE